MFGIPPTPVRAPARETSGLAAMMSPVATRDPEADGPMTSGMVALVPSAAHADHMAVDGGEDPKGLHLTLAYLGDNATDEMDAGGQAALHHVMAHLAADSAPIDARVVGHTTFNPDGGPDGDRTPCAVHLVGDSPDLTPIREAAAAAAAAAVPGVVQYEPWIPHVTGAYDRGADALHYTGPLRLDTLRVAIGGQHTDYPLSGAADDEDGIDHDDADDAGQDDGSPDESKGLVETHDVASEGVTISEADLADAFDGLIDVDDLADAVSQAIEGDTENKASGDGPDHDTKSSRCLPDGSYRIDHPGHLRTAVHALTGGTVSGDKRVALRRHVIKHARRLGATNMVPDSIMNEKGGDTDDDKAKGHKSAAPDVEVKRVVRTQAGSQRYHKPIGTVLGPPRDAAAAKAQQNTDAVKAYSDLLHGNTKAVAPLNKMDIGDLEDLTRVAYSYRSTDPAVVHLRIQLANELARRGKDVKSYGALGGGASPAAKAKAAAKRKAGAVPLPKGVRAPHQEGGAVKSAVEAAELEIKAKYTAEQKRDMAKKGHALPDGSYPIEDRSDLASAIKLRNHGKGYSTATIHKHIVKCAKRLGATDMLPDDLRETKGLDGFAWDGTADAFTSGVLLGLSGLDRQQALEMKAGPPGHTFASPDPRAARLRRYWVHGPGAAKIRWGEPRDFYRCVEQLTKYVGVRARGLCFTGDTEFLTHDGVVRFADVVGTDVMVLTSEFSEAGGHRRNGRWVQAPVKSFGEHSVMSVTLRRNKQRKVIRATHNHRWLASLDNKSAKRTSIAEFTTDQLRPGMALAALTPHNTLRDLTPSPFGVAAGATFGDGHREVGRGARIDLWGEKDAALLPYFAGCTQTPIKNENGTLGVRVAGMPGSWKSRPGPDEGNGYLLGWLAGYIAADGTVNRSGSILLDCHDRDTVEFVRTLALRLGITTFSVQTIERTIALPQDSPLNGTRGLMYRLTFDRSSFPAQALVLPEHRRRFDAAAIVRSRMRWTVESVEDHGEIEEVFCVEVPDTHTFALADHIWVLNCNIYHRAALHVAPGQEDKSSVAAVVARMTQTGTEFTSANQLWVRDQGAVDGWRAYAPAWHNDLELVAELKALRPADLRDDEEGDDNETSEQDDQGDLMDTLDQYAGMADTLSPEDAYEQAMADDVPWELEAQGDLGNPREGEGDKDDSLFDAESQGDQSQGDQPEDGEDDDGGGGEGDGESLFDEETDSGEDMTGSGPDPADSSAEEGEPESGGIASVAELIADLLADADAEDANADRDPGDDADAGQAEGDEPETHPTKRRKPATTNA